MTAETEADRNVAMAREYFVRGDARRADLLDLFHPEFQLYFPKFGIKHGPQAFMEMVAGFAGELQSIEHNVSNYNFIATGPFVVVEGTTRGSLSNGKSSAACKYTDGSS